MATTAHSAPTIRRRVASDGAIPRQDLDRIPWSRRRRTRVHTPCQVEPELWFQRGPKPDAIEACTHCPLRLQCLQMTARLAAGRTGSTTDDTAFAPTHGVWAGHRMPGLVANRLAPRYEELNDDLAAHDLPTENMPKADAFKRRQKDVDEVHVPLGLSTVADGDDHQMTPAAAA